MNDFVNEVFRSGISDHPFEVLVHVRKADDIERLMAEIDELKTQLKKQQRDLYAAMNAHVQYLSCLDELKDIRQWLKSRNLTYRFRNI